MYLLDMNPQPTSQEMNKLYLNSAYFQNKSHLQNSINNHPQVAGSRPGLWPFPDQGLGREGSGQKFTCLLGE